MKENIKKSKKKKVNKKKNNVKKLLFIIILFFTIISIINKINEPKKPENLSLIVNNENIIQNLEEEIYIENNIVYLSFQDVKKIFDDDIYIEDEKIILSSSKKVAALELDQNKVEINGSSKQIKGKAFKTEKDIIYLPISELQNVYDIQVSYVEDYKNIIIDYNSKKLEKAETKRNIRVKQEMKLFSKGVEDIKKGSSVVFISEQNGWAKIRTQNGSIGYIKKNKLTNFVTEREDFLEEEKSNINANYKKDISKENISSYKKRKELIEKILMEVVSKEKKQIKIIYSKNKDLAEYKRFMIESAAILKECGITAVFE